MRLFLKNFRLFTALFILLSVSYPTRALAPGLDFEIKGDLLSVDLSEASLMDVLNRLKTSKGIWYKAEPSQLGERISAHFQNLPLERGLRRLLASQDYCLYFDTMGKLIGISLIKKDMKEVQRGANARPYESPRNMPPFTPPTPTTSSGPLYIPKPNPPAISPPVNPRTNTARPTIPNRLPAPNRVQRPTDPNATPENPPTFRPVPQTPRPPIPIFPEPPDEEEEPEEEE